MSTKVVGLLNKEVHIYDVLMYIIDNIDSSATVESYNNLQRIEFWDEESNKRVMEFDSNNQYYNLLLGKFNKVSTAITLDKDEISLFIIKCITNRFGGWFFEDEYPKGKQYFSFNPEELSLYSFEKKLYDKLIQTENDTKSILKTIDFITENKEFIASIVGNLLEENDKALLKCAFDIGDGKCDNCPLHESGKCSSYDEGGGFNKLGEKLLKKLNII